MSEIICKCGHVISEHYADEYANHCHAKDCACLLSNDAVEARYWARKMMKECNALQAKLDVAMRILHNIDYRKDKVLWYVNWQMVYDGLAEIARLDVDANPERGTGGRE